MSELDLMLNPPPDAVLLPLVRWWKERLAAGDQLRVEVDRPDADLGLGRTELVVRRRAGGQEQEPQVLQWDDELNAGLVALGVRATDLGQEGARFALALRAALRSVERQYGDGYLNAVLLDLVDESDLGRGGAIAAVRQQVQVRRAERGPRYARCREQIANAVGGRAAELRDRLGYPAGEVRAVMEKALALYLDERFSVSSRQQAGFL